MFQKIISLVCVICCSFLLISCSASEEPEKVSLEEQEAAEAIEEQTPSVEVESRKPLYVYNNRPTENPGKLTLKLNNEPLLLPNGYVRLVGVVSGPACRTGRGKSRALIEVAGKGRCVGVGDKVGRYKVVSVLSKEIQLARGGP